MTVRFIYHIYGFANEQGKPKYLGKFIHLSDYEIVQRYNSILRGFMNFYNIVEDQTSLNELVYILEFSLAHTIAAKHRLSIKKVYTKYGNPIKKLNVITGSPYWNDCQKPYAYFNLEDEN